MNRLTKAMKGKLRKLYISNNDCAAYCEYNGMKLYAVNGKDRDLNGTVSKNRANAKDVLDVDRNIIQDCIILDTVLVNSKYNKKYYGFTDEKFEALLFEYRRVDFVIDDIVFNQNVEEGRLYTCAERKIIGFILRNCIADILNGINRIIVYSCKRPCYLCMPIFNGYFYEHNRQDFYKMELTFSNYNCTTIKLKKV